MRRGEIVLAATALNHGCSARAELWSDHSRRSSYLPVRDVAAVQAFAPLIFAVLPYRARFKERVRNVVEHALPDRVVPRSVSSSGSQFMISNVEMAQPRKQAGLDIDSTAISINAAARNRLSVMIAPAYPRQRNLKENMRTPPAMFIVGAVAAMARASRCWSQAQ